MLKHTVLEIGTHPDIIKGKATKGSGSKSPAKLDVVNVSSLFCISDPQRELGP